MVEPLRSHQKMAAGRTVKTVINSDFRTASDGASRTVKTVINSDLPLSSTDPFIFTAIHKKFVRNWVRGVSINDNGKSLLITVFTVRAVGQKNRFEAIQTIAAA